MPSVHTMTSHVNTMLIDRLRDAGCSVDTYWEHRGPKDTMIAWLTMYMVTPAPHGETHGTLVLVQTYKNGRGWEAFVQASKENSVDRTVESVLAALK